MCLGCADVWVAGSAGPACRGGLCHCIQGHDGLPSANREGGRSSSALQGRNSTDNLHACILSLLVQPAEQLVTGIAILQQLAPVDHAALAVRMLDLRAPACCWAS